MYLDLQLLPMARTGSTLVFAWDSVRGLLAGPSAEQARGLLDEAMAAGQVGIHPLPASWPITDPYHDPVQFAAVLGRLHVLPPELAEYYPLLDGAAGMESDVPLIY